MAVLYRGEAEEDSRLAAAQLVHVGTGPLEGLPGELQEQSLLRVERPGLARREPEECRVEEVHALQEGPLKRVVLARRVRVGIVVALNVPAIHRQRSDRVSPAFEQLPEGLGRG